MNYIFADETNHSLFIVEYDGPWNTLDKWVTTKVVAVVQNFGTSAVFAGDLMSLPKDALYPMHRQDPNILIKEVL